MEHTTKLFFLGTAAADFSRLSSSMRYLLRKQGLYKEEKP